MLFFCTKIDGDYAGIHGIHVYELVGLILAFIRHADKILGRLGYAGPIVIETALASIVNVKWLHAPRGMPVAHQGSELDDDVAFSITSTREALRENSNSIAMDILRYIFFSVNWPGLIDSEEKLEQLVRKGYEFNAWGLPDNLAQVPLVTSP